MQKQLVLPLESDTMSDHLDDLEHVTSLSDPVRRAVYRFATAERDGVDRNHVAAGLELGRSLAAYHLDKLVEDGLLVTHFEHRGTRRGPGSGRPSKIYRRAPRAFDVTLPPRDYSLAADVLASALEGLDEAAVDAVKAAATEKGRTMRATRASAPVRKRGGPLDAAEARIAACGYEPYHVDGGLRLRNCPFDAIADVHRDLVCTMNLALLDGLLAPADDGLALALEPADGECCVSIRRSTSV